MKDFISLNETNVKNWNIISESGFSKIKEILQSYKLMTDEITDEIYRKIVCDVIDASNCEKIHFAWINKHVSKNRAKVHVNLHFKFNMFELN